ncbi:uncharacterized protein V6R79_007373 [Siganus canaliculatus]
MIFFLSFSFCVPQCKSLKVKESVSRLILVQVRALQMLAEFRKKEKKDVQSVRLVASDVGQDFLMKRRMETGNSDFPKVATAITAHMASSTRGCLQSCSQKSVLSIPS